MLSEQGHNVIVSVIAPFRSTRLKITDLIPHCKWIYIKRLQKYSRLKPYEPPVDVPVIDTGVYTKNECYNKLRKIIDEQSNV